MKRNILKFASLLLLVLAVTSSCEMRDELIGSSSTDKQTVGEIYLQLALFNTKVVEESPEIDDFIVQIFNSQNEIVKEGTYKSFSQDNYTLELPVGDYKLFSASYAGEVEEAVFNRPYYSGEQAFTIKEKERLEIKDTCKLSNVKVAVSFDQEFLDVMQDDYVVTLTNGTGILNLNKDKNEEAYFKVAKSITIAVRGTTRKGQNIYKSQSLTGPSNTLEEGHKFTLHLGVNDTIPSNPDPEPGVGPGDANFSITIDVSMTDREEEIVIPRPGEEGGGSTDPGTTDPGTTDPGSEDKGKPSISGAETYVFDMDGMPQDPNLSYVRVYFTIPNGMKNLYVNISSTSNDFMTDPDLSPLISFDVVNPGSREELLAGLGIISLGENLEGKTSTVFDVTGFVGALAVFDENTHNFNLEVVDLLGNSATATLVIKIVENL